MCQPFPCTHNISQQTVSNRSLKSFVTSLGEHLAFGTLSVSSRMLCSHGHLCCVLLGSFKGTLVWIINCPVFSSAKLCCSVHLDELSVSGYSNAHGTNYRDDTELITVLDGFKYIGTLQICVSRMMQESAIFYGVCSFVHARSKHS